MARGPRVDYAWLGDAIAIKDPTVHRLPAPERQQRPDRRPERRGGPGHDDDGGDRHRRAASAGRSQACRFYLLDGSPVDSALSGQLGRLKDILPHPVTNVTWRDLGATFTRAGRARSKRRQQNDLRRSSADLHLHL